MVGVSPGFGTKAETLMALRPLVTRAQVPELYVFAVEEWHRRPGEIVGGISRRFGARRLAVRSSALGEDGEAASMAGAFASRLGVDGADAGAVADAVRAVVGSYRGDLRDQVLVQPMVEGVAMSGVVMTRGLGDGAPYYVVNYDDESGRTDTITGGTGANKTVHVHREVEVAHLASERIARVVEMARELEAIFGPVPLDIEFTMTRCGALHLLQVRRISASARWEGDLGEEVSARLAAIEVFLDARGRERPGVLGRRTMYGVMPDWNPAEILGTTPGALAVSLYRELVTRSVWREARVEMGYRAVPGEELMVVLAGRPYIDVRSSFNSLLPADLPDGVAGRVVDAWLDRLEALPELHDKVEFEVAQTCLDFRFRETFSERFGAVLPSRHGLLLEDALRALTAGALRLDEGGTLALAEARVRRLAEWQRLRERPWVSGAAPDPVAGAASLLEECREHGTRPFAVLARHAFVAESLMRSAVEAGALSAERLAEWRRSVHTVSGDFVDALRAVAEGGLSREDFLARFGHLRPGTYDIRSPTYAGRPEIFSGWSPAGEAGPRPEFSLRAGEARALDAALRRAGLPGDAETLLEYARRAVAGREYAKFVFSRNLSDALELIARWGEREGLDREALSHLSWGELADSLAVVSGADLAGLVERGRRQNALARQVKLGHLVRDARDLYVVPQHRSQPNFLGTGHLSGPVAHVDAQTLGEAPLEGRIVCIENADPGYDWIFGRRIAGLVTKYGGTNSHMAIRCAEFGLPAAIGCGPQLFDRILAAGSVDLDCAGKLLRPLHEG